MPTTTTISHDEHSRAAAATVVVRHGRRRGLYGSRDVGVAVGGTGVGVGDGVARGRRGSVAVGVGVGVGVGGGGDDDLRGTGSRGTAGSVRAARAPAPKRSSTLSTKQGSDMCGEGVRQVGLLLAVQVEGDVFADVDVALGVAR